MRIGKKGKGGDILLKQAKYLVSELWDIRPVQCIELQAAIETYEHLIPLQPPQSVRIGALDRVTYHMGQLTRMS